MYAWISNGEIPVADAHLLIHADVFCEPCEKCEGTVGAAKARLSFPIFTLESFEPHPRYL